MRINLVDRPETTEANEIDSKCNKVESFPVSSHQIVQLLNDKSLHKSSRCPLLLWFLYLFSLWDILYYTAEAWDSVHFNDCWPTKACPSLKRYCGCHWKLLSSKSNNFNSVSLKLRHGSWYFTVSREKSNLFQQYETMPKLVL